MATKRAARWRAAGRARRGLVGCFQAFVLSLCAAVAVTGCGDDLPLPPPPADAAAGGERQATAFLEAMRPRGPGRPVVAVLARNEGTELTDFLVTHGVLRRADVAEVRAVAPRRGRVRLYPALEVEIDQDLAAFDRAYPDGADYVIVPALDDADDPVINDWLQRQAARGARIVAVCAGTLILGHAGLLDGRRFTSHWYFRGALLERHPSARYVPHQRYVADGAIATTTGITASIPAMLALVEAIGGRERAREVAAELGVDAWSPVHDSSPYGLTFGRATDYLLSKAAFWRNQRWRVDVRNGMDDEALALAVDAWTRTGHVRVVPAAEAGTVTLRSGLVLVTPPVDADLPRLPLTAGLKPVQQFRRTLCEIGVRYGEARLAWVKMELEYGEALDCAGTPPAREGGRA